MIKITVRLVDTVNGLQVWGDQYQRQLRPDKLIALQEEIAQILAAKIGSEYGIIPRNLSKESRKKPPESLDTYEAFLQFYNHINVLTHETFEEALRALELAVTREPECGLAWSQLAQLYGLNYTLQFSPLDTSLEKALVFAKKGVSLDSQNQLVRATMAYLHFRYNERDRIYRLPGWKGGPGSYPAKLRSVRLLVFSGSDRYADAVNAQSHILLGSQNNFLESQSLIDIWPSCDIGSYGTIGAAGPPWSYSSWC
jgi:hypothetical protein